MQVAEDKQEAYQKYIELNSSSPYSRAVVDFAERWVDLMENALDGGQKLEDVASDLSHKADTEGITGFMYGAAAQSIAHFWIHGEQFRQWYNVDTAGERGAEANKVKGATINPAILTIQY